MSNSSFEKLSLVRACEWCFTGFAYKHLLADGASLVYVWATEVNTYIPKVIHGASNLLGSEPLIDGGKAAKAFPNEVFWNDFSTVDECGLKNSGLHQIRKFGF